MRQQTVVPPIGPVRQLSRPGSGTSSGRKSAWERAEERFQEQERAMVENKKNIPVELMSNNNNEEEELFMLDVGCCNTKAFRRVLKSKKFKNPKLEQLYQRYFFKLNQTNLTWLMALLSVLCIVLVIFHYAGGSPSIVKGIVLGIVFLGFVALETISNQSNFKSLTVVYCFLHCVCTCSCHSDSSHHGQQAPDSVRRSLVHSFLYLHGIHLTSGTHAPQCLLRIGSCAHAHVLRSRSQQR